MLCFSVLCKTLTPFLPEASFGLRILSLPASDCLSVHPCASTPSLFAPCICICVYVCMHACMHASHACMHHMHACMYVHLWHPGVTPQHSSSWGTNRALLLGLLVYLKSSHYYHSTLCTDLLYFFLHSVWNFQKDIVSTLDSRAAFVLFTIFGGLYRIQSWPQGVSELGSSRVIVWRVSWLWAREKFENISVMYNGSFPFL